MEITKALLTQQATDMRRQEQEFLAHANQANGAATICEQLITQMALPEPEESPLDEQ